MEKAILNKVLRKYGKGFSMESLSYGENYKPDMV